ncbi:hypothetical protein [Microbacterium sp. 10M-3C3]|jgi:predicted pyridoxine 5'-phosphate oxidase superfamily flavin-nucleotide-binding protein|uniref:hypothetical protein n=1 Tax=Microbacterium sp. 10M-3C3 TaxID=2483401 RepID=UPI000F645142|nr:hypothetical protein [Microbacterium sp. 10M-3C3]
MTSQPWAAASAAPFVLLGTTKRSGEEVGVPVWIAPDGDELVVTSERTTGTPRRTARSRASTASSTARSSASSDWCDGCSAATDRA